MLWKTPLSPQFTQRLNFFFFLLKRNIKKKFPAASYSSGRFCVFPSFCDIDNFSFSIILCNLQLD